MASGRKPACNSLTNSLLNPHQHPAPGEQAAPWGRTALCSVRHKRELLLLLLMHCSGKSQNSKSLEGHSSEGLGPPAQPGSRVPTSRAPHASALPTHLRDGPHGPIVGTVRVSDSAGRPGAGPALPALLPPHPHLWQETLSGALWDREYELL